MRYQALGQISANQGKANKRQDHRDSRHLLQQPRWQGNEQKEANLLPREEWALAILNTCSTLGYALRLSE